MLQTDEDVIVGCRHCGHRFAVNGDSVFVHCPSCGKSFDLREVEPAFFCHMVQALMRESLRQQQEETAA